MQVGELVNDNWDNHWTDYLDSGLKINPASDWRFRMVFHALKDSEPGSHILDIGCGTGELVKYLSDRNEEWQFLGIDISLRGLQHAKGLSPRAQFLQCDLQRTTPQTPEYKRWADVAVCSEVLEHVDNPHLLLINAKEMMKPGGLLLITVPSGSISDFDRHIGHRQHFSSAELSQVIRRAGLNVEVIRNVGFPFFDLYRKLVLLRGQKLIKEVSQGKISRPAAVALWVFKFLLRLNLDFLNRGDQLFAIVTLPE
jgi:2-polyprenyl-3-methyl-5-hydroxy-6-metoxy-1,4-benzoquinol methylase